MQQFGPALSGADRIVFTDIYGAGEDAIDGITIEALAASVRRSTRAPVDIVKKIDELADALANIAQRGDVVLTLGAGSIGSVAAKLVAVLEKKSEATA